MWYTYILRCSDGSFYAGITTDVEKRLLCHNSGKASKYTRSRRPVELLYIEKLTTKSEAISREKEIKNFSVKNKRRLVKFGLGRRFPSAVNI